MGLGYTHRIPRQCTDRPRRAPLFGPWVGLPANSCSTRRVLYVCSYGSRPIRRSGQRASGATLDICVFAIVVRLLDLHHSDGWSGRILTVARNGSHAAIDTRVERETPMTERSTDRTHVPRTEPRTPGCKWKFVPVMDGK
ncbi:hypothetical protein PYCCODRAFT_685757 [Trametes coccinea BRFM310]|uniref:Uncharacterized protein n=1 Tax=Trametes coccinea (strain BRFM310) TaxID=1353009 RepID=A0A1Y2IH93_TRAC3|nr:hypothetical protein PYCCODRAFT_685757 [Trametes coccinea BRFM310]